MLIRGGVRYTDNGIKIALKAMQLQQAIVGITNENVTGFDKVGYQRKEPVVSSFTEYLGAPEFDKTGWSSRVNKLPCLSNLKRPSLVNLIPSLP